jgi:hypothetical protein
MESAFVPRNVQGSSAEEIGVPPWQNLVRETQPIGGEHISEKEKKTNRCFVLGMKASSAFLTITLFRWPKSCANAGCLAFQVRIFFFFPLPTIGIQKLHH